MILYVSVIFAISGGIAATLLGLKILHIFQLEGYKTGGLVKWVSRDRGAVASRYTVLAVVTTFAMLAFIACFESYNFKYLGILIFAVLSGYFIFVNFKETAKVKLNYTNRLIRLLVCFALINTGLSFLLVYFCMELPISYCLIGLMPIALFGTLVLSHFVMAPFESLNNYRYVMMAKRKLKKMPGLIKIGITGSYGKTSVKSILSDLLQSKFKVCSSPKSYNTPMGICRVINNNLSFSDEILIAEMGARKRGDIAELTKIVKPDAAIITAIGNQHLETFKSEENIAKTKYELIEGMNDNGFAVFNGVNTGAKRLYDLCPRRKILVAERGFAAHTAYADNIKTTAAGCSFRINIKGQMADCETKLLGEHNINNIVMAAATAYELGVSITAITDGIRGLLPIPHRLESVPNNAGLNIIDDAYNANPQGVRAALKALKDFGGRKIVITPGMVELGDIEQIENIDYGRELSKAADYCILIGRNAELIYQGLIEKDFDKEKIFKVATLNEAQDILSGLARQGDTVLFSNDLPDNY